MLGNRHHEVDTVRTVHGIRTACYAIQMKEPGADTVKLPYGEVFGKEL